MKGMQLTLSVVEPNNFDLFVEEQASVAQIFERLVMKLCNFSLEFRKMCNELDKVDLV